MTKLYTLVRLHKGKEEVYMTDSLPKVKARKKTLETSQKNQRMNYRIRLANDDELKYQRPPSFNFDPSGDAGSKKYLNRKARAKRIKQKNPRNRVKECPGHTAETDCEIDPQNPCEACNAAEDARLEGENNVDA